MMNNDGIMIASGHEPAAGNGARPVSLKEKLLLPAALLIAILFDRIVLSSVIETTRASGIFWLCWLTVMYAVYWGKLRRNALLWCAAIGSAALCIWNIVYAHSNVDYGVLTCLVVPAVLMVHAQMAGGGYGIRDIGSIAEAWIAGWLYRPFQAIGKIAGVFASLFPRDNKAVVKRALISVVITVLLFSLLIPLLSGADMVFGYYLERLVQRFDPMLIVLHILAVFVVFALFYSFMWNIGFGKYRAAAQITFNIDAVISGVVLCSVIALYLAFCGMQFTYLFAGAGLPNGMTYAEYAREGFAQTVAVCVINLTLFALFLRFGTLGKMKNYLLAALASLTCVILYSGFVRLNLYIEAYGLTWLRLISGWFMIYLAVVIVLCMVRLFKKNLPVFAVCAVLLLGWYTALGYMNPERLIDGYNLTVFHM